MKCEPPRRSRHVTGDYIYAGGMSDSDAARRIRAVLDMYEFGERMYRTRMQREHPDASQVEIESLVNAWRVDRPGAPAGDAVGRVSERFG